MQLLFSFDQDMKVDKLSYNCNSRLSTLMQLLFSFDQDMKVDKLSYNCNSRLSTLMQLLFSFDQDMRVDKAVIQTLARQHSWNSCSLFVEIFQLRKPRANFRLSTLQDQQNVLKRGRGRS